MSVLEFIEPKTNGTLAITVESAGTPITTAVVTATVYQPDGSVVATDVACAHQGLGVYNLPILPPWSTATGGSAIEGLFVAEVKAVYNTKQRVRRLPYKVAFRA